LNFIIYIISIFLLVLNIFKLLNFRLSINALVLVALYIEYVCDLLILKSVFLMGFLSIHILHNEFRCDRVSLVELRWHVNLVGLLRSFLNSLVSTFIASNYRLAFPLHCLIFLKLNKFLRIVKFILIVNYLGFHCSFKYTFSIIWK
jgi:hypothetical protein